MLTKLKAVYTLVEQLYTGSQRALAVVALSNEVPTHLADVLRWLAVLPQRFQELRRASARAGAIAALSRAKQAEAALTERTAELSGLIRHVSQMVSTIFGKSFCKLLTSLHSSCLISPTIAISSPDFVMQVPEAPTLIKMF